MQAYPLSWPSHKPRTPPLDRKYGRFSKKSNSGWDKSITLNQAVNRLLEEIDRFTKPGKSWRVPPESIIISTDLLLRNDGLPRSGQKKPNDPGVAVYFNLDGKDQCIPVDSYTKIEQNIAAVADVIKALRTLERHDSKLMESAFTGFQALPDPARNEQPHWTVIFDVELDDPFECVQDVYKRMRGCHHPDRGGDKKTFNEIQRAWKQFKDETGH